MTTLKLFLNFLFANSQDSGYLLYPGTPASINNKIFQYYKYDYQHHLPWCKSVGMNDEYVCHPWPASIENKILFLNHRDVIYLFLGDSILRVRRIPLSNSSYSWQHIVRFFLCGSIIETEKNISEKVFVLLACTAQSYNTLGLVCLVRSCNHSCQWFLA